MTGSVPFGQQSEGAAGAASAWQAGRHRIDLSRPRVMGIVNLTPDSFSDGGQHPGVDAALAHAERLLADGADILDVGGESTRPGAHPPGTDTELARVIPVLRELVRWGCPISVDTSDTAVIEQSLALGADIVNDVRALQRPGALEAVAAHPTAGVCLMHMQGAPASMQAAPAYDDVVRDVAEFLRLRARACFSRGIAADRVVLDPGFGFGKSLEHNLLLAQALGELGSLGYPVLVGWSRKGTLGQLTGRPVDQRVSASVAAALASVARGARIVRVHDVAPTVDALKVWQALGPPPPRVDGPAPWPLHLNRK